MYLKGGVQMKKRGKQELHLLISLALLFLAASYLGHSQWIRGGVSLFAGVGFFILTINEMKKQRSRK
jgi:hypothetical protein